MIRSDDLKPFEWPKDGETCLKASDSKGVPVVQRRVVTAKRWEVRAFKPYNVKMFAALTEE